MLFINGKLYIKKGSDRYTIDGVKVTSEILDFVFCRFLSKKSKISDRRY